MAKWKQDGKTLIDESGADIAPDSKGWMENVLGGPRNLHMGDFWTKP